MVGIFARPLWPFHQIWLFRCATPRSSRFRNHLICRHLFLARTLLAHRVLFEGAHRTRKTRGQTFRDMKGVVDKGTAGRVEAGERLAAPKACLGKWLPREPPRG